MTTAEVLAPVAIGLLVVTIAGLTYAQTALSNVTRARARALVAGKRRGSAALIDLLRRPEDIHTPLVLLSVLCLVAEATLVGILAHRLWGPVGVVTATAVNGVAMFVLATAAPRTWALTQPGRAGSLAAPPVRLIVCRRPVQAAVAVLIRLVNVIVPGRGLQGGPYARPEPDAADRGARAGVLADDQQELVESIAEFADTVASEVMTHRPDMITVDADALIADVIDVSLRNGYTRLPVCGNGIDDILGLVYSKDLMRAERDGHARRAVAELVRPGSFVPETKRLPELLREMQHRQLHMAIVVDEYGGTAGLVTLEDIIEELVGDIVDEFDIEDKLIELLPDGDLLVRGRAPLAEINRRLPRPLPEGEWDTVGGLLSGLLGHLPVVGESVDLEGWRLTTERIHGRRVSWVRVAPVPDSRLSDEAPSDRNDAEPARGADDPESGFVGGVEALPFGLLIFVVGALLIANLWAVVDARFAVDAAAREATRLYVEADVSEPDDRFTAEVSAVEAGLDAVAAHGRDRSRAEVRLHAVEGPPGSADDFTRCARVTFTASYRVPALALPWLGGLGDGFDIRSEHTELIDPYRDGVPGDAATC